jgi:hypothetical protein
MHCANLTISFWTAALVSGDSGVPPPDPLELLEGLELLVVPMWATPELGLEDPPHAARSMLAAATHKTLRRTSWGRGDTGAPLGSIADRWCRRATCDRSRRRTHQTGPT